MRSFGVKKIGSRVIGTAALLAGIGLLSGACTVFEGQEVPTRTPAATTVLLSPSPTTPATSAAPATGVSISSTSTPPTAITEVAPSVTPIPTATPIIHTVQPGETLGIIAGRFEVELDELVSLNEIPDPNNIVVGAKLQIPPPATPARQVDTRTSDYTVLPGETFSGIATKFGISVQDLLNANPGIVPEELLIGQTIQVPWVGVYIVAEGQNLSLISTQFGVEFDDLVQANLDVLDIENLGHVLTGVALTVPSAEIGVVANADCSFQGGEARVITYTIQNESGPFCLASKYGLTLNTILDANPDLKEEDDYAPGVTVFIPPADGAIYTLTDEDVDNEITVDQIAEWYSVPPEAVVDWNGNVVSGSLESGQALFIPDASVLAGTFNSPLVAAFNQGDYDALAGLDLAAADYDPGELEAAQDLSGSAPFGGLFSRHWNSSYGRSSPGYCPWQDGYGWSGAPLWPFQETMTIERGFLPGHNGLDIRAPLGTPVIASEGGVVVWAGLSLLGGGYKVVLAHGDQMHTHYIHLDGVAVSCGQQVGQGSVIGYSGESATYYPHLHYEINQGSVAFDPCTWLRCP